VLSRARCAVKFEFLRKNDRRIVSAAGAAREENRSEDRTALLLFYRDFNHR